MPFIRYTRDKRGYETTFVMHGYRPAQGPQRTRVLYLFRSPSHVRFGRRPLDEESREALEHTHPDLSFDWTVLGRESEAGRADDRDRERERDGSRARRGSGPGRQSRPPAPPPPPAIDDQSVLGRTVGSDTASRYRARYNDLLQRITRRSRTPEERDRLMDRAQRLNPDDWPDAEAVRAHAQTIEAEWDAVAGELPARRRGRRGGRRRDGAEEGEPQDRTAGESGGEGDVGDAADPSGIMADGGEINERQHDLDAVDAGDSGGPGSDASGDRSGPDSGTAGHDVPVDDKFRPD